MGKYNKLIIVALSVGLTISVAGNIVWIWNIQRLPELTGVISAILSTLVKVGFDEYRKLAKERKEKKINSGGSDNESGRSKEETE